MRARTGYGTPSAGDRRSARRTARRGNRADLVHAASAMLDRLEHDLALVLNRGAHPALPFRADFPSDRAAAQKRATPAPRPAHGRIEHGDRR